MGEKPIAEVRIGHEFFTQERAELVGVGTVECSVESIAFVWWTVVNTPKQYGDDVLARSRPVVRTVAPRGKPVGGEVNTDIVLTAAAHDGGYGGVDAVNLMDTALSKVSIAALEDRVRADIPNHVLGYVHVRRRCSSASGKN
nr:hypothetical protein [Halosolutus amylolyticus]